MTSSCENGLNEQYSHAMYLQKLASKYYKTFLVSLFLRLVMQQQNKVYEGQIIGKKEILNNSRTENALLFWN